MTTFDTNRILDQCKFSHNRPILIGLDDLELVKRSVKKSLDDNDFSVAIQLLTICIYSKEN